MSAYDVSLALMVPDALKAKANLLACALGHDALPGNTYSVPLSADGSEPATHWACHAWVQQSLVEMLSGAGQGVLPPIPWEDYGLTEADVYAVLAALVASEPSPVLVDFDAWAAGHGLERVQQVGEQA